MPACTRVMLHGMERARNDVRTITISDKASPSLGQPTRHCRPNKLRTLRREAGMSEPCRRADKLRHKQPWHARAQASPGTSVRNHPPSLLTRCHQMKQRSRGGIPMDCHTVYLLVWEIPVSLLSFVLFGRSVLLERKFWAIRFDPSTLQLLNP